MIYIDADDFHENNTDFDILQYLHKKNGMKFNLFTVPGLCSKEFIREMKKIPWIDMIPHGWHHETSDECDNWGSEESEIYLQYLLPTYKLTKGFKAPGWRTSPALYISLMDAGYWICDHHDHDGIRPSGMKVFHIPDDCHFHVGGTMQNRITNNIERLEKLQGPFGFIKDLFQ